MIRLNMNENLSFFAKATFFCAGFLWTRDLITIKTSWDYVVVHMLTIISGLGLCTMLIMWSIRSYGRKAAKQESLPAKQTKNCATKCS